MINPFKRWLKSPIEPQQIALAEAVIPQPYQTQLERWSSQLPPDTRRCLIRSVTGLIRMSPQLLDQKKDEYWLEKALNQLDQLTHQPINRAPQGVPKADWLYLIIMRIVCEALAYRYTQLLHQRVPLQSTWIPAAAVHPIANGLARQNTYQGLASVLAGKALPKEGKRIIYDAGQYGIDWCHSEHFWHQVGIDPAIRITESPTEKAVQHAMVSGQQPGQQRRIQPHSGFGGVQPSASCVQHPPPIPPTPLSLSLVEAVTALASHNNFNRCGGLGWFQHDLLWVNAKALAERLQRMKPIQQQPALMRRTALYQALLQERLISGNGSQPVWSIFVQQQDQRQFVSVLKIPAITIWPCTADYPESFTGTLVLAAATKPSASDHNEVR